MPPVNDNLASAVAISGISGTDGPYTIDDATDELGEVVGANVHSALQTIWWAWTCPATGTYQFDTETSVLTDNDTTLAAWEGTNFGDFVEKASDDDSGTGFLSKISFIAVAGTTYYIQAGTFGSPSFGYINLNWTQLAVGAGHLAFASTPQSEVAEYSAFQQQVVVYAYDGGGSPIEGVAITLDITTTAPGVTFPPFTDVTNSLGFVAFWVPPPYPDIFEGFDDTSGSFDYASQLVFSAAAMSDLTWDFDIVGVTTLWSHTGSGNDNVQVRHGEIWKGISNTQIYEGGNWYNPCASAAPKTVWFFKDGTWQKACGEGLTHAVQVDKWAMEYSENGNLVASFELWWPNYIPPETRENTDLYDFGFGPLPHDFSVYQTWGYTINGYKPGTQNGNHFSPVVIINGATSSTFNAERDFTTGAWVFNPTEIHSDTLFAADSSLDMWVTDVGLTIQFDFCWDTILAANSFSYGMTMGYNYLGVSPQFYDSISMSCRPGSDVDTSVGGSGATVSAVGGIIGGFDFGSLAPVETTLGPGQGNYYSNNEWVTVEMNMRYVGQRTRPWNKLSPTLSEDVKW